MERAVDLERQRDGVRPKDDRLGRVSELGSSVNQPGGRRPDTHRFQEGATGKTIGVSRVLRRRLGHAAPRRSLGVVSRLREAENGSLSPVPSDSVRGNRR
jgi:hypothetical protein